MATKTIAWTTGSGNITLTYIGQGNGYISVASDENESFDERSQSINIITTNGSPEKAVSVLIKQQGKKYAVGDVFNFDYTGNVQQITLPKGKYKLQCWGAQGGSVTGSYAIAGSKGGYSEGVLTLTQTTTLYVFVGGQGTSYTSSASQTSTTVINGGWNGGGAGVRTSRYNTGGTDGRSFPRGGGGATDISTVTASLSYSSGRTTRSSASLLARCIVAGGGAGASARYTSTTTTSEKQTVVDSGTKRTQSQQSSTLYTEGWKMQLEAGKKYKITQSGTYATRAPYFANASWVPLGQTFTPSTSGTYNCVVCSSQLNATITYTIYEITSTTSTSTSSGKSNQKQQGGGTSGIGQYPGKSTSAGSNGAFGLGASQTTTNYRYCGGGGGGGWYGGGTGYSDSSTAYVNYSGGGSGFVNTAANASSRPSGYTGLQLDSGTTIAGNTSHPSTSGGTETGHSGNGYAKITILDPNYVPDPLEDYTLLSYIQSSGSQYIKTGIYPNQNTKIEISAYTTDESNDKPLFGERNGNNVAFLAWTNPQNSAHPAFAFHNTGNVDTYLGFASGVKHTIVLYNGVFSCDGKVYSFATKTFNSSYELLLFGLNNAGSVDDRKFYGRVYSCKIYDGGTLVRDYIPVKRNSDGVCGLWDKVNEVFYTSGSGTNFTGA